MLCSEKKQQREGGYIDRDWTTSVPGRHLSGNLEE